MPLRTHCHGDNRRPVRVVLPPEPPTLTPAAARVLLRILIKAQTVPEGADQMAGTRPEGPPARKEI
jgi:hypothetical protein